MPRHKHRWPEWEEFENGTFRECGCGAVEQKVLLAGKDFVLDMGFEVKVEMDDYDHFRAADVGEEPRKPKRNKKARRTLVS